MKRILILLSFNVFINAFSQEGKVYLKKSKFIVGAENTYVYEPPQGVIIKEKAKAKIVSGFDYNYDSQSKDLIRKGKLYEFNLKLPDSIRTILLTINDSQSVLDNNKDHGYSVCLKTQNDAELSKTLFNEIYLRNYGSYLLNLKLDTNGNSMLAAYESLYAKYPNLKNDKSYIYYLYQNAQKDKEKSKTDQLAFAKICLEKNTEEYLIIASNIYAGQAMLDEKEKLDEEILKKYPSGQFEKMKFMRDFYGHPNKTESYVLKTLETYKTKYKDSSEKGLSGFYYSLMRIYVENRDLEKAEKLEFKVVGSDGIYNQIAWKLSGQDLTSPVKDLGFALKISKRSIDVITEKEKVEKNPKYQGLYNMYTDTYALLLYKQGNYEEAFKYQDAINTTGGLDDGGKERYLAMMEKVKGKDEVKKYIEHEINADKATTPVFLAKLKEIYVAQNLPLDNYEILKAKAELLVKTKRQKEVIGRFGGSTAADFTLKNIEGKEIKLSDYKGKVVVLDFWATWCGPCKASFPKMQELVTKYKDKSVAFLFINTMENTKEADTFKKVTAFISDKNYSFNVLFDSKKEVAESYNVLGIPTRVVIDKNGNLLTTDYSDSNITEVIDAQLN